MAWSVFIQVARAKHNIDAGIILEPLKTIMNPKQKKTIKNFITQLLRLQLLIKMVFISHRPFPRNFTNLTKNPQGENILFAKDIREKIKWYLD